MRGLELILLSCLNLAQSSLDPDLVDPPFNEAITKDPITPIGEPISSEEFQKAATLAVKVPEQDFRVSVPVDHGARFRNYVSYTFTRWPNRRVPYTIDQAFDGHQRLVIAQAMLEIEKFSCIRFQPKTGSDRDFVHIYSGHREGCWADDHYLPKKGQHIVHLHPQLCLYKHIIVHELLHLLGVGHEQQRPDRDDFVKVHWDNINIDHAFNFFKDTWDTNEASASLCSNWREIFRKSHPDSLGQCSSGVRRKNYDIGYDFNSIMHYQTNFFALDPTKPTLEPLDPQVKTLGGLEMTAKDVDKLQRAYGCLGQNYTGCGGSLIGDSGQLVGDFDIGCEWYITVEDGFVVEFEFEHFEVSECDKANLTIFAGFKELDQKLITFCRHHQPRSPFSTPTSSATVLWQKTAADGSTFRLNWRKSKIECCQQVNVSAPEGSQFHQEYSSLLGTYYQVQGKPVYQAPIYRLAGNANIWMGRFVPMSTFSLASWTVAHEVKAGPPTGQVEQRGEFYFGGNVRCPHLLQQVFYLDPEGGSNYVNTTEVSITCL